jgi:hypothetical protein
MRTSVAVALLVATSAVSEAAEPAMSSAFAGKFWKKTKDRNGYQNTQTFAAIASTSHK